MLVRNAFTHDTRVEKEARSLIDVGFDVTVLADAALGLPHLETRRDGIRVVRVPRPSGGLRGLRFARHELTLASRLRELAPDVLHAHDSNALVPVALAARWLHIPFVYDAHELWLHRPRRGRRWLYGRLFAAYYLLVQRWSIPRASATLTVSGPIARHLQRSYGLERVELVPNYPDVDGNLHPTPLRSLAVDRLPPETPIVLHLGGLMAERGLEEIVEAVSMHATPHLVFLGSGEQWSDLEGLAQRLGVSSRVHRLGPVGSDDVVSYAATASIGVVATSPSGLNNRYSLPNKLFQYMAAGVPVIASDFSQIREVVEAASCGLVVDTQQPRAIAAAMHRLLADPQAAGEMGARGRAAVLDRYNWATSARTLQEVYAALTAD